MPADDTQALYEDAACGLLVTAADGRILRANRTFCRWLGHEPSALVGQRRLQDLLTMGGRIFHQTHWQPLLQLQGSVAEVKLDLLHRDGHALPMMMNAVRHAHAGEVRHEIAIFIAEDRHQYERELVRARQHAELLLLNEQRAQRALEITQARLRLALESARLSVWEIDAASGERRYGDDVAWLLGAQGPQPVSAERYAAALHPDDVTLEREAFERVTPQEPLYACVVRLRGEDGLTRTVGASGRGFFTPNGQLQEFIGVLQDITEQARRRTDAEDRALLAEQMVGIVSHDLRNPLSAIQMSSYLLQRGELTAAQHRVLGRITAATNRAQRLIGDLLDFTAARVGSGLAVSPRAINLGEVVAEAVEELRLSFAGRMLQHQHDGEGDCTADGDRLAQLIGNLVGNAMTYGAADRPVVVRSRMDASGFEIAVHNEGPPIDPALLPSLFEPMTRGSAQGAARSVGLGLFIVREIARAHRGEVTALSTAEGTTFSARFPRGTAG
jgi:sigma-B regulation protein RsbU (phosphoserine phosphatase)